MNDYLMKLSVKSARNRVVAPWRKAEKALFSTRRKKASSGVEN